MNKEKEKLLTGTLTRAINMGFGLAPDEDLEEVFAEKIMVIGTAVEEKYTSLDGLRKLIQLQKEQSQGMELSYERTEVYRDVKANEQIAIIVEDIWLNIKVNDESTGFGMRASAVLEYKNEQWKIIHWHVSKPEHVESEKDTYGIEEWKQKADALEKLVAERTADLVVKNRELEIETALEKVRSRTMAMQHSDELAEASFILDSQVRALGIPTRGCAFNIYGNNESTEWFSSAMGTMPRYKTPREDLFLRYYEAGKNGETIHVEEFAGHDCRRHYEYLCTLPVMGDALRKMIEQGGSFPERQIDHVVYFKYGYVLFITLEPAPEAHDIFIRFAQVFEQTYTRFLDLQKAEAQAREAQIEAALERVRSRSMGMQKSEELKEVIRIVYDQLDHLNIHVQHAGFIVDYKKNDDMHIWLADKHAIPSEIRIPYFDTPHWNSFIKAKKNGEDFFTNHFSFEEKNAFYKDLFKLFPVGEDAKEYYAQCPGLAISTVLLDTVGLYIENFSGDSFSDEENRILMRFGKVFQQTYTRFLDLQKAEAQALQAESDLVAIKEAKQKAEAALTELQATQKQLIQSEKMASLGELTAGIAHEIQNPLNFVNNFSEVSTELVDEMNEELNKGDIEEAKAIANDVKQNLEKINHHGKRAGDIVKGMLQHSRSSSGQKEPTNINALSDEYLRLAYHGLRAKDKSFNATLKTDFDESISNIDIIPQDMGRVILNLITNAFYVVDEKKKSANQEMTTFEQVSSLYEPTVSVSTKKFEDKILIRVKDNGNGIPQKILDKIFQPFFTTKPTGLGTGLGLSLSYDIVKAHGGELTVETKEGEGSCFTIALPQKA
ncbi:MAG TPA: ATP-binding protein [Ferruginibacter sp.]|nr:ATP-binding protein [Ferruginibacter sp.]